MTSGVVRCCFLVVLVLSFRFKWGVVDIPPTAAHCRGVVGCLVDGYWTVVGQSLVGLWLIIELGESRIWYCSD